jgi:hypothetical protein
MGTPILVEIGQQHVGAGKGGVNVAVNRPRRGYGHELLSFAARIGATPVLFNGDRAERQGNRVKKSSTNR